jgi:hypothetical protein
MLFSLSFIVGLGKQRHLGQIFLLLFTWLTLRRILSTSTSPKFDFNGILVKKVLIGALFLNFVQVAPLIYRDAHFRFSSSSTLSKSINQTDLVIVQDSGKNTYLPLLLNINNNVFSPFGATWGRTALMNQRSRSVTSLEKQVSVFRTLCESTLYDRVVLFTDADTRAKFGNVNFSLISRSSRAMVETEEAKELWLLASGVEKVKNFCNTPNLTQVFSAIQTPIVAYGK